MGQSVGGIIHFLSWALPALLIAIGFGTLFRPRNVSTAWSRLLASAVVIFAVNALLWDDLRPGLSWIAVPGSILTRVPLPLFDVATRRAFEPAVWLFALVIAIANPKGGAATFVLIFSALGAEVLLGDAGFRAFLAGIAGHRWIRDCLELISPLCGIAAAVLLVRGLLGGASLSGFSAGARARLFAASAALPMLALVSCRMLLSPPPIVVGAHYYSWFPENWVGSFIGEKMTPPVEPELGRYNSTDADVVRRHVEWARMGGVDFFVLDWWPRRRNLKQNVMQIADMLVQQQMPFAIHFESLDIAGPKEGKVEGEPPNVLFMNEKRSELLCAHLRYVSERLLRKPGYLRMEGRPVIFFYSTRHLVGPVAAAFAKARQCVAETIGEEPFFVGDEVYFNVLDFDHERKFFMRKEGQPVWSRLRAFDAITAYNPFDPARPQHGGTEGVSLFLSDVRGLYEHYRAIASSAELELIPAVLPGYNDRGVRPDLQHPVIPRFPKDGGASFLDRALEAWAAPLRERGGMLLVTSFNEWNEGSQIEPAARSPRTSDDVSRESRFSGGEQLEGYGTRALDELRRFKDGMRHAGTAVGIEHSSAPAQ